MLAEITLEYSSRLTKEQAELLSEQASRPVTDIIRGEANDAGAYEAQSWTPLTVDLTWMANNLPGVQYTVKKTFKTENDLLALLDKFTDLANRMERMPFAQGQDFNAKVNVHVPNLGLLMMDEVDWMEDACTERLQDKLDDGWRILAICPQPDQRRPDYILGRTKIR